MRGDPVSSIVQSGERRVSSDEILANASRGAAALATLGVNWGDRVAVMLRNDIEFLEAIFACDQLGAYSVTVNWHFKGEEVHYLLTDSESKVLIVHSDLFPEVREHVPADVAVVVVPTSEAILRAYDLPHEAAEVAGDVRSWPDWISGFDAWRFPSDTSPGSIIYTSGTTGRPKGVKREPMDAEARERYQRSRAQIQGSQRGMRSLMASPLYHAGPNATARTAFAMAAYLNIMPRFDAEEMLRIIERERITNVNVVPIMLVRLLALPAEVRDKYDLSSVRECMHGAGPCPAETKRRMIEWWGPVISETYGSTEIGLATRCTSQEWLDRPGTVGRPMPGVSVRVVDGQGREVPPGTPGELFIKNTNSPRFTYLNKPEATAEVIHDGYVTNGDIGYLDADGYLYITDRKRDMIISGGVNIYPAEIEAVMLQCPGVRDCAAFGIPDDQFGEAVAVAVARESEDAVDADAIRAFLNQHIARYKIPKVIEFHQELPREGMGKMFKNELRKKYWKGVSN